MKIKAAFWGIALIISISACASTPSSESVNGTSGKISEPEKRLKL